MNNVFEKLGVSSETRAFLNLTVPAFDYGSSIEHFGINYHRVPTTPDIWQAGDPLSTNLFIANNAMEIISFHNIYRCNGLFIALGNKPQIIHIKRIKCLIKGRKVNLIFSNDVLGKLTDIYVATSIINKPVRMKYDNYLIDIEYNETVFSFKPELISLNLFEKMTKVRSGIRTYKSKTKNTFLEQLQSND